MCRRAFLFIISIFNCSLNDVFIHPTGLLSLIRDPKERPSNAGKIITAADRPPLGLPLKQPECFHYRTRQTALHQFETTRSEVFCQTGRLFKKTESKQNSDILKNKPG